MNPSDPGGLATYTIDIAQAGTYAVWGRVIANGVTNDSFYFSVDGEPFRLWQLSQSQQWTWDRVWDEATGQVVEYDLSAAQHTLIVKQREDGTKLDALLLTTDLEFTP